MHNSECDSKLHQCHKPSHCICFVISPSISKFHTKIITDHAIHTASHAYRQKRSSRHLAAMHVIISHNYLCIIHSATSFWRLVQKNIAMLFDELAANRRNECTYLFTYIYISIFRMPASRVYRNFVKLQANDNNWQVCLHHDKFKNISPLLWL